MTTKLVLVKLFLSLLLLSLFGLAHAQDARLINTVLMIDISGSMDGTDSNRVIKLQAAKEAAVAFIEAIQAEKLSSGANARDAMALISFCNEAKLEQNFTEDLNLVRNRIIGLTTCGSTNMTQAFQIAQSLAQMQSNSSTNPLNIILLGDGMPTESMFGASDEQSLKNEVIQTAQGLRAYNACLYAIAIGNPNTSSQSNDYVDLGFLRQVKNAVNPSCGELYASTNTSALIQNYLSIRVITRGGEVSFGQTSTIQPNQTINLQPFDIEAGTQQLRIDINVSSGTVTASLFDPKGVAVSTGYPGAVFNQLGNITQVLVNNPAVGTWRAQVFGANVPAVGANFTAVVSTTRSQVGMTPSNATPTALTQTVGGGGSSGSLALLGVVIILLILTAGGMYAFLGRGSISPSLNNTPIGTTGYLVFLNGAQQGQLVTINAQTFDIGRGGQNQLVVADNRVSRSHARITYRDNTFFIQDLGSRIGTFVNQRKIKAVQPLQAGDVITIGSISFQFRR